jgi:bacterial/archaeal transporter family-2 protein
MTAENPDRVGPPRSVVVPLVALAFLCGAGVAVQSRINGELGTRLDDGFLAALLSFGGGLLLMIIALALSARGRRGVRTVASAVRERRIPFWYVLGGSAGALLVLSQGLVAGVLGVALFTIGIVAGQSIGGLIVDRRGLGTMEARALTAQRVIGSLLALAAVALAVSEQVAADVPAWLLILPFAAGLTNSWQQAVNGQVRAVADSAITATFGNFVVGTLALAIAFVIHSAIVGWPNHLVSQPWLYLGGAVGVMFIALGTLIVRTIGVLLLSLATIAGQLVVSLVIDIVLPVPGSTIALTTIAGTALTLVAVAIAAIPGRARPKKS